MDYQQAWTFLDNLQFFKIKLGLDAMDNFLGRLGNPQHNLPCVHIGGTNGKGSVAATLTAILTEAGYKVGLYTSPHLSSVRERFRIGNRYISEEEFAGISTEIVRVLGEDQITYFEFTTTLALLWFAEQKVDLALMEVGMGGRLDATNIVSPLVTVITNVGMDHEQYLGNTLEQVAAEKAGIIKAGVPVISGVGNDVALGVVVERCKEMKSPLYLLDRNFSGQRSEKDSWHYRGLDQKQQMNLPLAMKGGYQVANASLALAALECLKPHGFQVTLKQLRTGLSQTRWPGRLEEFRLNSDRKHSQQASSHGNYHFLLDGAHNPDGVKALRIALENEFAYDRLILIWGAMADKDNAATLQEIAPLADYIYFTRPESERSAMPEALLATLPSHHKKKGLVAPVVEQALEMAMDSTTANDLICIAGSLYLVGRARKILLGELV